MAEAKRIAFTRVPSMHWPRAFYRALEPLSPPDFTLPSILNRLRLTSDDEDLACTMEMTRKKPNLHG